MYTVTRLIKFCYGHRLLNYDGKCQYVHGHNGQAELTLETASLDERGMVVDFTDIKHSVSTWIDEHLDHRMLFCRDDPLLPVFEEHGQPVHVMDGNPTAENIAKLIFDVSKKAGFPVVEVRFWETDACCAAYRAGVRVVEKSVEPMRSDKE